MTVCRIFPKMKVTRGDITGLKVQAIVNLADKSLLGSGHGEVKLLASCCIESLKLAIEH